MRSDIRVNVRAELQLSFIELNGRAGELPQYKLHINTTYKINHALKQKINYPIKLPTLYMIGIKTI